MFNEFSSNNATLLKLIENDKYRDSFSNYYIPNIEKMSDGKIFIDSHNYVIEDNAHKLVKFIIINKLGNITADSSTKYAELVNSGYLVRLIVQRPLIKENVMISYIVDINNISLLKDGDMVNGQVVYKYNFESIPIYLGSDKLTDDTIKLLSNNEELFTRFIEPIK